MLSTILPGVREIRTPLVTGCLWFAVAWLALAPALRASEATDRLLDRTRLLDLPQPLLNAGGLIVAYLVGSLLTVRPSQSGRVRGYVEMRIRHIVFGLDNAEPRNKLLKKALQRIASSRFLRRFTPESDTYIPRPDGYDTLVEWLQNEFESYIQKGFVPVTRTAVLGGPYGSGLHGIFSSSSLTADGYRTTMGLTDPSQTLLDLFVREVAGERTGAETRIQMRHPELYAEIDRLRAEAELRLSLFWPVVTLGVVLSWNWTPWALLLLPAALLMVKQGKESLRRSSDKTWAAVVAGEVSTPVLDQMKNPDLIETADVNGLLAPWISRGPDT